jgi:hypothetical protein
MEGGVVRIEFQTDIVLFLFDYLNSNILIFHHFEL